MLLHGEDAGLIRRRAEELAGAVLDGPDDPFRLVWLNRDEIARLPEEASALSLIGGRRVVRVREASDAALPAVRAAADRTSVSAAGWASAPLAAAAASGYRSACPSGEAVAAAVAAGSYSRMPKSGRSSSLAI